MLLNNLINDSTCLLNAGHLLNATLNHYLQDAGSGRTWLLRPEFSQGTSGTPPKTMVKHVPARWLSLCYQGIWCKRSKVVGWRSPCWALHLSTVCGLRLLLQTRFSLIPWTESHRWRNCLKLSKGPGPGLDPLVPVGEGCVWWTLEVELLDVILSNQAVCFKSALLLQKPPLIGEVVMDYLKRRRENCFWKQHLISP